MDNSVELDKLLRVVLEEIRSLRRDMRKLLEPQEQKEVQEKFEQEVQQFYSCGYREP